MFYIYSKNKKKKHTQMNFIKTDKTKETPLKLNKFKKCKLKSHVSIFMSATIFENKKVYFLNILENIWKSRIFFIRNAFTRERFFRTVCKKSKFIRC